MRRTLLAALLSSLTLTAAASPVMFMNDDASALTSRPISSVTEAHLVYTTRMGIAPNDLPFGSGSTKAVLRVNLDERGTPVAVRVLQPINPTVDDRVVNAVRQFRWTPAVLDNKPVATEVLLTVEVQR